MIRKRLKRREVIGGVRYVTFTCYHCLPLLGNPLIRDLFVAVLYGVRAKFRFELFAWVVMPEHVHILARPLEVPFGSALHSLKQSVAEQVIARWRELDARILKTVTVGRRAHYWEVGGGFDRNVRDEEELCREIRYIHRNPVEAGLVERPEDWAWSSVRWWMGRPDEGRPCDYPPGDPRSCAAWKGYV